LLRVLHHMDQIANFNKKNYDMIVDKRINLIK